MPRVALVIGAGFSGLSTASLLRKQGWEVTLWERNAGLGGRASLWESGGYRFDMGPSWYLMPEVFDRFFAQFGTTVAQQYSLTKLSTQYKVFFEGLAPVTVTDSLADTKRLFESFEPGGAQKLERFLAEAKYKYDTAMKGFLYKDYRSVFDFLNWTVLTKGPGLGLFSSLDKRVSHLFGDRRSRQILEYAMVFLGSSPSNAPSLYSLLSHVDLNLGVWFPQGGMHGVAEAMAGLFTSLGGRIELNKDVAAFEFSGSKITGAVADDGSTVRADLVVNTGDYAWGETTLLPAHLQSYSAAYWNSRTLAPSMFLVFLGVKKRLKSLEHHNLWFSADWDDHFVKIFERPEWPSNPCFYLSAITKTDPSMAPPGCENLFLLVPVAPGLEDGEAFRQDYLKRVLAHVEAAIGETFQDEIEVVRVFTQRDFIRDYHAWKGTGLGLSHTLFQTAVFRPARRSRKVPNLFYSGQYTHPGVGVPMTLISSQVTAEVIARSFIP
jgi:phytoene desaturase